jgi:hypothetical protein
MIEEKIKLNSKLIVMDAFKSGQKQNETPVYKILKFNSNCDLYSQKYISFQNESYYIMTGLNHNYLNFFY